MNIYFYYIILIVIINYLLFKLYFINFSFYILSKQKLKKEFKHAKNNYIHEYPSLIADLSNHTIKLNEELNILKNS